MENKEGNERFALWSRCILMSRSCRVLRDQTVTLYSSKHRWSNTTRQSQSHVQLSCESSAHVHRRWLPAGWKLTGVQQELEITGTQRTRRRPWTGNKGADWCATGTEQVWWNSHEERQSLAWVTPAAPKVMKERARGGTTERWEEEEGY